jgi:plastocyanin
VRTSPRTRLAVTLALAALIAAVPIGSSFATGGMAVKTTNTNKYKPKTLKVAVGTEVDWSNPSRKNHEVVAYKGPWSVDIDLARKTGTGSYTFLAPGVYRYRCEIQDHSDIVDGKCVGMCGTVKVSAPG